MVNALVYQHNYPGLVLSNGGIFPPSRLFSGFSGNIGRGRELIDLMAFNSDLVCIAGLMYTQ